MKTQQLSEKAILAQNITPTNGVSLNEDKKGISLPKKLSLRPQKSLIRKSIRPINLFSQSVEKETLS